MFSDNGHANYIEFIGCCIGVIIKAQNDTHSVWLHRIATHRSCYRL